MGKVLQIVFCMSWTIFKLKPNPRSVSNQRPLKSSSLLYTRQATEGCFHLIEKRFYQIPNLINVMNHFACQHMSHFILPVNRCHISFCLSTHVTLNFACPYMSHFILPIHTCHISFCLSIQCHISFCLSIHDTFDCQSLFTQNEMWHDCIDRQNEMCHVLTGKMVMGIWHNL